MNLRAVLQFVLSATLLQLAAGTALAQAPGETLFGPKQYVRVGSGAPTSYSDTFAVPQSVGAPFVLRITNGAASGHNRVSSAWVRVNGVQVAGPADFGQKVAAIERSINLSVNNTLEVQVASVPGAYLTITVLGTRILPVPTSLTPNPLTVTAGASANLVATLSPAPTSNGILNIASSNPSVASVPASVAFAAGQTQVAIPVAGVNAGTSSITASANGGSASATVNVTAAPPTIAALAPATLTVMQGGNANLTVTISAAQTTDTTILVDNSNSGVASAPSSVTVPAHQLTAQIPLLAISPGSTQIAVSLNGTSAVSQVTVTPLPPTVVSLLPTISTVTLGAGSTLTLTISAAQSADTVVPIAVSPAGIVSAPAEVTVPAGQVSASVPIATLAYGQAGITASLNGSTASAAVNVVPPPVAVTALEPVSFTMTAGATSTFTVKINAAQLTNTEIALAVSEPSVLQVPASVTVAQGATSATFTVTGLAVGDAVITASANNTQKSASVHVSPQPAAIVSLLPNPLPLQQGATGSLTVTINVAQEADTVVTLTNTAPAVAGVPASVTLPAGTLSVPAPVTALAEGSTVVTASVNGTSASSTVTVTPPPPVVTTLRPAMLSLPKGTPGVLQVTLSRAPNVAVAVSLSSTDAAVASVPPQVNVPAGALFAEFPVMANSQGQATITATLNGGSATSLVTVAAPELATLTLSPAPATIYTDETQQFTATATMTDGTTRDFTALVTWMSANPSVAGIGSGGVATPTGIGTTSITASYTFTAVQTGQAVTITASTTLTVKQPVALVLSASTTTLAVAQSTTVTVTSLDPAPAGGLQVNLSGAGSGSGTFPAFVSIPENGTAATFSFAATATGNYTITAAALQRLPGTLAFNIVPQLRIESVTPASGGIGDVVTLTGSGFDPVAGNNSAAFRGANNSTVAAAILGATATEVMVRVPPLAETGPITLTHANGSAQSPQFTVLREQDFQLVASPAAVTVYQGASGGAQVQLASTGTNPFTGLVSLMVQGLPSGVTASFSPAATLSAAQAVTLNFAATAAAPAGSHAITLRGEFVEAGANLTRTAFLTLNVQSSVAVTGIRGRFVTPAGIGIAGVVVRADTAQNPQPQTTTDAAGNFLLVGLPAGSITFRFDATPANPLYPIWPYTTTIAANQVTVISDWTINPPPSDDKFVPIANAAQTQVVTDERYPGLEIRLPAGASIVGYDGVVKTRVAVEKVELSKLTVTSPPVATGSTYQLHFGTPMGGIPSAPIPVTLPNDIGAEAGASINIWYFDGSPMGGTGEWKIAGQGIVSADGKTIRMPDGTGIPRFCGICGLLCAQKDTTSPETDEGPNDDCSKQKAGNPVNLATGQETPGSGGLSCRGLTPLATGLTYNPVDAFNNIGGTAGSMGFGWVLDYDIAWLAFQGPRKRLVLPGNNRVNFTDDGSGVYRPTDDPRFDGAEMRATNLAAHEWELKFRDGRIWRFKPFPGVPFFLFGGPPTFVTEMIDPQGNVLPIARQPNGRITSIGTGERGVTMTYGTNGFVSAISDTAGRSMSYTYTPGNRLASVTDPDGRLTSYTYVGDNEFPTPAACEAQLSFGERLKTITYPGRPTPTENFYGPGRRVLRQSGYDGREFRFAYKVSGACVTHVSNPSVRCSGASCPDTDSWENFQAGWRIHGGTIVATRVTQPNGQTTSTEYNTRRVALSSVDAQGQKTAFKLDGANRVIERTDALGRTWKYQYDAKGNVIQTTDPLGRVFNATYHPTWNKPTSVTRYDDANQPQTWTMTYDAAKGTLLTLTNPLNQATTFEYTARGQLERVIDALTHATTFQYNAAGDLTQIIDALANETTFASDGAGRRIRTTDALGNISRTAYNGVDSVTRVTDANGRQTNLAYDPAGRLESVTNARNFAIESYGYDGGDRLTSRTDAKTRQTLYGYDTFGRLSTMTDRRGLVSTYAYDEQDRVTSITRADGVTRFAYDAVGRLAEVSDPSGTISYAYDAVDRLVRETQAVGAVTSIVEYAYDALDRRTSRTLIGVPGEATGYGYDAANRLTSITYRGATTTLEYDAAGRLTKKILPNGIRQEFGYDDADRLLSITYKNPDESVIEEVAYGYDAAGRRVTQTVSTNPLPDTAFTAEYDEADRMTSLTLTATGQSFSLTYDLNGNLAEKRDNANSSNVTTYTWDSRNRLAAIGAPGMTASFQYDAMGRRILRTVNGQTTRYVYDGLQAVGEVAGGEHVGLLTTLALDEVIARYPSQGLRVYLTDALNSVLAQTNADRAVQNYYSYSAYGEASPLGPDEGNAVQYTARENDSTGLYYYRARYYDPVLKRFISEDPIGLVGGINQYGYVFGTPTQFADPTGEVAPLIWGGLVLAYGFYEFMDKWSKAHKFTTQAEIQADLSRLYGQCTVYCARGVESACRMADDLNGLRFKAAGRTGQAGIDLLPDPPEPRNTQPEFLLPKSPPRSYNDPRHPIFPTDKPNTSVYDTGYGRR